MIAPLRCARCGCVINKKSGAKTPKYCPPCRQAEQKEWKKANLPNYRIRR